MNDSTQIWAVSDGRAGNARQSLALAEAVAAGTNAAVDACLLAPRLPWRLLAPHMAPGSEGAFGEDFRHKLATPPALAIGCGRQAALATRLLLARGAKCVQVLDPRTDPWDWDLVVAPQHDGLAGGNVITTLGSLHPVDDAWLAAARAQFADFADLPRPRTAVLLGGPTRHARFERMAFEVLASKLEVSLARDGGSVLLTTSRRTPRELRLLLRHYYDETPGTVWLGASDPCPAHARSTVNPYPGLLAWADRIVCSPDSVNMVSEACATRVPVHVFDPDRVTGPPRRFLDALLARGRIRALDARLAPFEVEPLRETARVADEVRQRLLL